MFCNVCESIPCSCRSTATGPICRDTFVRQPDGITKEEFGLDLYETIKTIGGLLGIEQQRAAAIHYGQGYKLAGLLAQRTELCKTLAEQLPRINDRDMADLLQRYPWIVSM